MRVCMYIYIEDGTYAVGLTLPFLPVNLLLVVTLSCVHLSHHQVSLEYFKEAKRGGQSSVLCQQNTVYCT